MTREEAITVFKAFMDNPLFSDVHKAAFNIAIHDIKQRHDWDINNLILINKDNYESQEPKTGQWIPVSERLPEKEGRYLTTILNEYDNELRYIMTCDYFSNGSWCPDDECASSNVIAWMPLPKLYEPQESEDAEC